MNEKKTPRRHRFGISWLIQRERSRKERLLHNYGLVLIFILLNILVQMAATTGEEARVISVILYGFTLTTATLAAGESQRMLWAARITAGFLIAASAGASIGQTDLGPYATRISMLILVVVVPVVIVRGLFRYTVDHEAISVKTMYGVLCIYLLFGLAFAASYGMIAEFGSSGFFESGANSMQNFLFFSFTTLTTTGYGNLIPIGGLGLALATLESLIGQIYLVTVVATIVSQMGPGGLQKRISREEKKKSPSKT